MSFFSSLLSLFALSGSAIDAYWELVAPFLVFSFYDSDNMMPFTFLFMFVMMYFIKLYSNFVFVSSFKQCSRISSFSLFSLISAQQ